MNKETRKRFGRILRKFRDRKGYTQDEFAHHIGAGRAYYGRIERGEINFGFDKIEAIIKGLETKWSTFFKYMDGK